METEELKNSFSGDSYNLLAWKLHGLLRDMSEWQLMFLEDYLENHFKHQLEMV